MAFGRLSLKGKALKLLAAREHSRAELERKLAGSEEQPGQLRATLDELEAKGFINERRVVDSVIHRRASRLGVGRIRQELQAKGVAPESVNQAVAALRATETQRAEEVWRKKFGRPATDSSERARQTRFLAARGFSGEAIRRVLASAHDDAAD